MTRRNRQDRPYVEYCRYSGKVRFDKRGAVTAKNARYKQAHVKLRVYVCPDCGGWHLTHKMSWGEARNF